MNNPRRVTPLSHSDASATTAAELLVKRGARTTRALSAETSS